jgi:hypothetical protein
VVAGPETQLVANEPADTEVESDQLFLTGLRNLLTRLLAEDALEDLNCLFN